MTSLVGRQLYRCAFVWISLAAFVGCGSLGCGTLLGYGIGRTIDAGRFTDLPKPYSDSLVRVTGKVVRATLRDGDAVAGRLVGVTVRPDGEAVCFIGEGRRAAVPGSESRVDTIGVASILAAQVASGGHAYRDAGIFVGLVADATVISLVGAALDQVGTGASK